MAERIVREIGFDDCEDGSVTSLSDRLSWAIRAMEDDGSER